MFFFVPSQLVRNKVFDLVKARVFSVMTVLAYDFAFVYLKYELFYGYFGFIEYAISYVKLFVSFVMKIQAIAALVVPARQTMILFREF